MIQSRAKKIMVALLLSQLVLFGCATQQDQQPGANAEMMAEMDQMEAGMGDSSEVVAEESGTDFGAEDMSVENEAAAPGDQAATEDFGDDFGSEDFGNENFSEEELSDADFGDDALSEDAFADTPAQEPATPPAAEPPADQLQATSQPPVEPDMSQPMTTDQAAPYVQVQGIDFVTNTEGGTIKVKTSGQASYTTRYNPETNQYIVEIQNATLAEGLTRPYIMKDFKTPFGAINAYQNPGGLTARIVVQMKDPGEPIAQQEGDTILLLASTKGTSPEATAQAANAAKDAWKSSYNTEEAAKDEKVLGARTLDEFLTGSNKFYGRPINIQVTDGDVREIINFIADEAGVNIVMSDEVKGKISMKLQQIPWDQALIIVMRSQGLGYVRQGNVIRITTLATLQAETKAAKEIIDTQARLTPLKVKVIPISYGDVKDVVAQVTPFLTDGRGKVVADNRTSSIIITDTADVLNRVERLVQELDIPPAQVMIESKIVEATEDFSRTLGVNWGFSGVPVELAPKGGFQGNPVRMTTTYNSTSIANETFGALNSVLSLNIGTLDFFGNLDARLGLAQTDSLVKVISSPRVVTMNRVKAEISQTGQIFSIQKQIDKEGTLATTATAVDVKTVLGVTPQITAEGSVILDVDVLREFPGAIAVIETQSRPINKRSAKTKILVPNGQTAVIGGIYQSSEAQSNTGVPGLKDVPVLGWLFKNKTEERSKNELLIFLTPRILNAKEQGVAGS